MKLFLKSVFMSIYFVAMYNFGWFLAELVIQFSDMLFGWDDIKIAITLIAFIILWVILTFSFAIKLICKTEGKKNE